MVKEFCSFYSKLYASPNAFPATLADKFFRDISLPKVANDHIELMEGDFTEGEIKAAIKSLHPSKAPGPDGFSGHYHKKLSELLVPHLCSFFNVLRKELALPTYENAAFIHVIPKPGKDHGDRANYHPISINVDLKLMTKVLPNRMNTFLSSYIYRDQVGFVPNCQAPDQTRRRIDVISAVQSNCHKLGT